MTENEFLGLNGDHLGNVRLSYANIGTTNAPQLEIIEESNYFPFGLKHRGYNAQTSSSGNDVAQRWKFGGKELDENLGLGTYDFGARNYNPELGRWMNIDPQADERDWLTPYNFVQNDPISRIDPDGELDEWNRNQDGTLTWISGKGGDQTDYVNNLDADGNVTSTETYDVEINVVGTSETSERDIVINSSPGERDVLKGRGGAVESLSILDIASTMVDLTLQEAGEDLGVNPTLLTTALILVNPKKALKKIGRRGKQKKLKELADDPKLGKADKGWIKQEINQVDRGKRKDIRNPPGKDLAHERGREAAKGYSYEHSNLQDRDLHRRQHKYDKGGRKNKERPINHNN